MAAQDTLEVDVVAVDPRTDTVVLMMVEVRPGGMEGQLLGALQARFNTYLAYALDGRMLSDDPDFAGKPVRIELMKVHAPGQRELAFLDAVSKRFRQPERIDFQWSLLAGVPARKPEWKFW